MSEPCDSHSVLIWWLEVVALMAPWHGGGGRAPMPRTVGGAHLGSVRAPTVRAPWIQPNLDLVLSARVPHGQCARASASEVTKRNPRASSRQVVMLELTRCPSNHVELPGVPVQFVGHANRPATTSTSQLRCTKNSPTHPRRRSTVKIHHRWCCKVLCGVPCVPYILVEGTTTWARLELVLLLVTVLTLVPSG